MENSIKMPAGGGKTNKLYLCKHKRIKASMLPLENDFIFFIVACGGEMVNCLACLPSLKCSPICEREIQTGSGQRVKRICL